MVVLSGLDRLALLLTLPPSFQLPGSLNSETDLRPLSLSGLTENKL